MTASRPRGSAPKGLVVAALRAAAPGALGAVVRRTGSFDDSEDALQEAMLAAAGQWQRDGIPDNPTAWLITVAMRRAIDGIRADASRRERERRALLLEPASPAVVDADDTLAVYLMCCHPSLTRAAQVPLTLRVVGGLTTREIARGLLASETSVAQRISRAKATLRASEARFALPREDEMPDRISAVLDVLGLIHTESHNPAEQDAVTRPALSAEALRLARELLARTLLDAPWRGEVMGLVALMLLTNARTPARTAAAGTLIPLAEQDRSLWIRGQIDEGEQLLSEALRRYPVGAFQLRAAIAAVHDTAPTFEDTDWKQLLGLYDLLRVVAPGPIVELARLVALAETAGADTALLELDLLEESARSVTVAAVRAHLLRRSGRDASAAYGQAAAFAHNGAQRRWFEGRASGD